MSTLKSGLTVFGLGFGTVFVGLIMLIVIISAMSAVCRKATAKKKAAVETAPATAPAAAPAGDGGIEDRGAFAAAVAASIATVMGKDVDGIRIVSVKKAD